MQPIIVTTIYLLTILIPLTFTTINSELFEFPKFILLLAGTLVITLTWALHIYKTRDYSVTRARHASPLHIGMLAVLATQTIATIFSINPYTSFWGYYSRFHGGLLTTICYTIIYFAATKWMDNKSTQKLIKISVITAFFISLFAIAEHFGIDKNFWLQDVQSRPFSTLGQPNWLAAYLLPNLFLTLYLSHKQKSPLHLATYLVLFTAMFLTKSRSGYLAFAFAYLTYWLLVIRAVGWHKIKTQLLIYTMALALPLVLFHTPISLPTTAAPSGNTALETGGTESGDIRKIVWTGALKLIQKYPFLGTGPETFAYTYYWVRPAAHNLTSEWDFLYNKAHNEYLNIAAGAGLLGLSAYLYFHYAVFAASFTLIPKSKKTHQDNDLELRTLYPVLGSSIVAFTITNFFGFSVIPVYLLMILVAALPTAAQNLPPKPLPSSIIGYWLLVILLPLIYPARLFYADYLYAKGKALNSIPLLEQAVAIRPGLDLYHAQLGELYATAGQNEQALAEVALNKQLNPYHLNFYKSRAKIYLVLNLNAQAASELEQACQLAPTDPKLAYNLALVYTRLGDLGAAETKLKTAIALKPNYSEPYYALTLLYEQVKHEELIPPLLSSAKTHLATYSAQLKDKIDKYVK